MPNETQAIEMLRYLLILELMEANAIADCETQAVATTEIAAVDFKKGIIHATVAPYGWWKAHGYRKYARCVAVRTAYIAQNESLFALLTDLRPQQ